MSLKLNRIKRNMTQSDLFNDTGISLSTIVRIEKGRWEKVQAKTIVTLAEYFNTTMEDIIRPIEKD